MSIRSIMTLGLIACSILVINLSSLTYLAWTNQPKKLSSLMFSEVARTVLMLSNDMEQRSGGTGFIVRHNGKLSVITNAHVCGSAGVMVAEDSEHRKHLLTVQAKNEAYDLCKLTIPPIVDAFVELAEKASERYEPITLVGHPFLKPADYRTGYNLGDGKATILVDLKEKDAPCEAPTYEGKISTFFGLLPACLQDFQTTFTSLTVHPGNSGSPVLNDQAELVGVINLGDGRTATGSAVRYEQVKEFLDEQSN